jgi:HD-GYP domain-containing protein (c-di-GMP phosphodiesterase class II)
VRVAQLAGRWHEAQCSDAVAGYWLHDVGVLGVADSVLASPEVLGPVDRMALDRHPVFGAQLMEDAASDCGCAVGVVRHHHERWDGAGYPDRLAGEAIPLGARIFAVADAVESMSTGRPYRAALPPDEQLEQLRHGAGSQFDPRIARAAVNCFGELLDVLPADPGRVPSLGELVPWGGLAGAGARRGG